MLEHTMFKGTKNFGTLDEERDQALQKKIEAAYQVIAREERSRDPDRALIEAKKKEMVTLREEVLEIYVPQAFSVQLGRNGAIGINAFTSRDQTQYVMSVPSDMLEQWFSIVSEQLFEPAWREFYVEKEVIEREWAFRYVNNPGGAAWLDLNATAYLAHPYKNPIIGWKSDIDKYSTADAAEFHARYYNSSNAVCVLVGDITVEEARDLAEIYFGRYPAGKRAPERVTQEPPHQGPRTSIRFLKGARTPLVRIAFHGAPMGSEDFYALDAMTMVLSHGRGARINQNVIDKGLAVEAWAYNPDNRYGGMIVLGGSPNEPEIAEEGEAGDQRKREAYLKACQDLESNLIAEVEKLKKEPISARELQRIKKLNERGFLDRMRSNEDLATTLATIEVQIGWQYLLTYLQKIDEVSAEEIKGAAERYVRPEDRTSVYVIPGGKPERPPERYRETRAVSGSGSARLMRPESSANRSIYPTPKGWKHPLSFERRPERIEYPRAKATRVQGAEVFYLPDRQLPLIDLTLLVKAGAVDVAASKTGLAQMLSGSLIRGGTEEYSPSELALVMDENAIQLSLLVGEEDTAIRLSVMKEDWERGLALLEEILARPRFDADVLDVVKRQAAIALQRQGDNAQEVLGREANIWRFRGHPYGRDPLKGLQTIPTISRDDLERFLRSYFVPSNMVVAVAGDIAESDVLAGLNQLLGALTKGGAPERRLAEPEETPSVLALIHKPGQLQSQVSMSLRSVTRSHPEYWKVSLLMNIFGGGNSLMYARLRENLGLIYAGWFYQAYKWKAGMLLGYMGCKGDKTSQAIRETVKIMKGLRAKVPKEDLEQKRLDALNSFVFNVDTPAALVETYGRYAMREEPLDTLESIQEAFLTATPEELETLARLLLDPQKLQIFIVADKTTKLKNAVGVEVTLEEDLKQLAQDLGLPYQEIPLR
jgi:predicted Zn-dependent peptidase